MTIGTGGFRCVAVLEASSKLDMAELQSAWQDDDPFATLRQAGVTRYVRGLAVPAAEPAMAQRGRIGIAHLFVEDEQAALRINALLNSGTVHASNGILAAARIIAFPTVQRFLLGEDNDYGKTPLRAIFLVKGREDIGPAGFHRHWQEVHGPLVEGQDGMTRYAQHHRLISSYPGQPEFDGMTELSYPDEDAVRAFNACEPHRTRQMADLPNLFDLNVGKRFFSREELIF